MITHHSVPRAVVLGLSAALITGCIDSSTGPDGPEPVSIEQTEFAPELDIDLTRMDRTDAGTYLLDLTDGDGTEAAAGDTVAVHYTLWLPDGTQVEDSRELDDSPYEVRLVTASSFEPYGVIPGWVDGVPGMQEGGTRLLIIPWQLAYGSSRMTDGEGNTIIPSFANLIFEVELIGVAKSEEGTGIP